jgi:hypothetical protein
MVSLSTIATLSLANLTFGQNYNQKRPTRPGIFEVPSEAQNTVLDKLTRAMFEKEVNNTFVVSHPVHGRVEMYLKRVEDLTPQIFKRQAKEGIECFNLIFACQSNIELGQATYTMENKGLGQFELFIVQGTKQRYGRDYGAVINRLFP